MPPIPNLSYALDTTWRTLLKDLGVAPADVLRRAGLPDDLLQQPTARLASEPYYRLWQSLEAEAGDEPLPLRLLAALKSESFSPPLFAALCSPNLLVAAERIAHYKRLIGPIRLEVTAAADLVQVEFTWLDAPFEPPASLVVMELLFSVALARLGTREPVRPVEVSTPARPPGSAAAYAAFLGTELQRGPRHRVVFTRVDATRPFLTSNDTLWATFEPALRQRLADLDGQAATTQRVRAALLEGLPSGQVTMGAVARKLALSPRTLQRHVEAEGTSYQLLLSETREALARHYLTQTELPPAEIAFLLGFTEPTSFYRAFRTWTGTTPERLRYAA